MPIAKAARAHPRTRRRRRRRRARRWARRVPRRGRVRGQPGRDARGARPPGSSRRRPRCSSVSASSTSSRSTACAAPAAAVARRARKAASVATTLASVAPDLAAADAAQAVAEGIVLGAYQFLEYKGDGKPTKLAKVSVIGDGGADGARRGRRAVRRSPTRWRGRAISSTSPRRPSRRPTWSRRTRASLLRGRGVTVQVLDVAQLRQQTPRRRVRCGPGLRRRRRGS